ncbi:hypothetical protein LWI29_016587 [Acer saccharum]|uniref:Protein kinase domain-containing protein n=1 Tax=Acer saccharum TaxID=4024 RepID=A0AA39RHK0_ACESA|nr:hypothetical protein LWI29_016587 [Acer saccharum]
MPTVDISRHRNEINLANLAINKIQKQAVDELVDPCLGFHLDEEVKRTTTSVAELAFLCLQQIKEMRPSMDVVLEELHRIKSGECKSENLTREEDDTKELKSTQQPPPSPPHCEESALLKISCSHLHPFLSLKIGSVMTLHLLIGIGVSILLIVAMSIYIIRRHRKGIYASPNSRYTFSNPSSKSDLEAASAYFGVPIFSYSELAEATNNFNHKKKNLEMEVLELYTMGLLLVYEFIPNGTIADHLMVIGRTLVITWPIRMNIAIETASALAYLHASDIIHRNVKTNNILLDNNLCVKVADSSSPGCSPLISLMLQLPHKELQAMLILNITNATS